MTFRVNRETRVGRTWMGFVLRARPHLRSGVTGAQTLQLWSLPNWELPEEPMPGPIVYMVIGHGVVQYVGQTTQILQDRMRQHLADPEKARSWSHVAAVPLRDDVPKEDLDRLERTGMEMLRPAMGSTWPRRR